MMTGCARCSGSGFITSPMGYHVFCPICTVRAVPPAPLQRVAHSQDDAPTPDASWGLDIEWKRSDTWKISAVAAGFLAGIGTMIWGLMHLINHIAQAFNG